MKQTIFMLALLLFGLGMSSIAQEEESFEDAPVEEQTEIDLSDYEQPAATSSSADNPSPDIFQPSEQVSEDLSVSFPVDI